VAPFGGLNVHASSMACWKAWSTSYFVLIKHFRNRCVRKAVSHSFVRSLRAGSSLFWTPALRPLYLIAYLIATDIITHNCILHGTVHFIDLLRVVCNEHNSTVKNDTNMPPLVKIPCSYYTIKPWYTMAEVPPQNRPTMAFVLYMVYHGTFSPVWTYVVHVNHRDDNSIIITYFKIWPDHLKHNGIITKATVLRRFRTAVYLQQKNAAVLK